MPKDQKEGIRDYILWVLSAFMICFFVCIFLLNTKISEQKVRIEKIEQLLGEMK